MRSGEYEELDLEEGRLWLEELGLGLGLWQGSYEGVEGLWLRFYDRFGDWIPTPTERADYEAREKEWERQEKQRQRQRAISAENERDLQQQRANLAENQRDRERLEKEQEKQRADNAEATIQQLLDRLLQLGVNPENLP